MTSTFTDRLDGLSTSVAVKAPVVCTTTTNITLNGLQTIDGVSVSSGDRVLVKNQTDAKENGIYEASTSSWTRAEDFDGNRDVVKGTLFWDINRSVYYKVTTSNPITIGTSEISFDLGSSLNVTGLIEVNTNTIMSALLSGNLATNQQIHTIGKTTVGDGGGGYFRVTKSDISTEVTADTQGGIYIPFNSDPTGASGGFIREYPGSYVNPLWWGATPDGSTDSSTAIQECLNVGPCIITEAFAVTTITTSYYLSMTGAGKFVYNGAQNGTCLTLGADFGDIYVDGGLEDCIGATIDTNGVKGRNIYVERVTASATSSTSIYPIRINANNVQFDSARTYNTQNTGQANGSFPQAVAIVGTSDNTRISEVYCELGACALAIGSSTGNTFIRHARSKNMTDNGVYGLGGYVFMDEFIYEGTEEAYVAYTGEHNIGRLVTIGACTGALELQSGNNVNVGEIFITDDGTGYTASKAVLARSTATDIGRIWIGSIKGHIKNGTGIINVSDASSVEYIQIDNIDVLLEYDSTNMPTLNAWFDLTNTEQYKIGPATIRIRDVDDTISTTTVFSSTFPDPDRHSVIENFDVYFETSTGAALSNAQYRGTPPTDTLEVLGAVWQTNVGPYAREKSWHEGMRDSAPSAPAGGYWRKGNRLWHSDGAAASFGFYCTVAGTPGTWVNLDAS